MKTSISKSLSYLNRMSIFSTISSKFDSDKNITREQYLEKTEESDDRKTYYNMKETFQDNYLQREIIISNKSGDIVSASAEGPTAQEFVSLIGKAEQDIITRTITNTHYKKDNIIISQSKVQYYYMYAHGKYDEPKLFARNFYLAPESAPDELKLKNSEMTIFNPTKDNITFPAKSIVTDYNSKDEVTNISRSNNTYAFDEDNNLFLINQIYTTYTKDNMEFIIPKLQVENDIYKIYFYRLNNPEEILFEEHFKLLKDSLVLRPLQFIEDGSTIVFEKIDGKYLYTAQNTLEHEGKVESVGNINIPITRMFPVFGHSNHNMINFESLFRTIYVPEPFGNPKLTDSQLHHINFKDKKQLVVYYYDDYQIPTHITFKDDYKEEITLGEYDDTQSLGNGNKFIESLVPISPQVGMVDRSTLLYTGAEIDKKSDEVASIYKCIILKSKS